MAPTVPARHFYRYERTPLGVLAYPRPCRRRARQSDRVRSPARRPTWRQPHPLAAALGQLVVTIVRAILSWIACFCGSQSIQSHPSAPTRLKVKAYSRVKMNPRRAALPIVGYWPVAMSRTLKPKGIIPIEAPPERSEEHTSELQSQFHLVCR